MKVLFLDIDGVLNCEKTFVNRHNEYLNTGVRQIELENIMIQRLSRIVFSTGAKVVLSSTWRKFFYNNGNAIVANCDKGAELLQRLNNYNIEIYDITPYDENRNRAKEIYVWLMEHPEVDNFIIIDDETVNFRKCSAQVVKTYFDYSSELGLCDSHVDEAILKLNREYKGEKTWKMD